MANVKKIVLYLSSVIAGIILNGCNSESAANTASSAGAPEVNVAQVITTSLSDWDQFSGRLQAPESVVLIPRISGYISRVMFKEGEYVDKGDILLNIDSKPYEIERDRLQAQYHSAKSHLALSESLFKRGKSLSTSSAISQEALDNRRAEFEEAQADAAAIAAGLKRAELELSYTRVKAPISGRVSRADTTVGNFVTAGQSEITRIVSTKKMYAYFNVDERTYLKYIRNGLLNSKNAAQSPVAMGLSDNSGYHYTGTLDFIDNQIDSKTGSIKLRATFENKDGSLIPGLYAQLRLSGSKLHDGILIDEKAIGTDLNNKFVLVVNDNDTIEYRKVILGESLGNLRIVKSGLSSNDILVVSGLQRVMPGVKIQPKHVPMADKEEMNFIQSSQAMLAPDHTDLTASFDVQTAR